MKIKWIICIGGSDEDGVTAYYFTGTEAEAKALLVDEVKRLINFEASEEAEYFTESVDEVEVRRASLYAFVSFENYHIDVEAIKAKDIKPYWARWAKG